MTTIRSDSTFGPLFRKYYEDRLLNYEDHIPHVWIKVKINRIRDFNLHDMTAEVDYVLVLDWIDPSVEGIKTPDLDRDHFSPVIYLLLILSISLKILLILIIYNNSGYFILYLLFIFLL